MMQANKSFVPTTDEFRPSVLRVLNDGATRSFKEVTELVANQEGLDEGARNQAIPSGGKRYVNRIVWACSGLAKAGLIRRPKRGFYEITSDGLTVDERNLSSYSENDMLEWPQWQAYQNEVASRRAKSADGEQTESVDEDNSDPIEQLEHTVDSYNARVETELRRALQEATPEFFEKAVVELLWAMGYGGAHGEKQHVGKSGDGGIDGVIRQDALGLQNVYIQAKRYADHNNVQRPAIQQFYGALASKGAERGVFITTSGFSDGAIREANNYRGNIVLIDGIRLTSLMLAYGVAVQKVKSISIYKVDEDFFDSDFTA
ncbi:restriction endonuclease [Corynebacterium aquilae]|uniref:Restriction endonuclease n=1 Tax=Corynebacterium aquilae DSM 44791 TaxID=1431546 RepID=A0A1L7CEX2_9CORY|nr:restriction endonuclease [Corynebacterium aquilae]APT84399.1 hypothetical protein CAQU_04170 [Corynebacterium aquilae DSM 44791]